jgi:uroporphyrinogen-III synthase
MTRPLLVLRPQPGADATAERIRALGLEPVTAPLFRIVPLEWTMSERPFQAILLTSANAARALNDEPDRQIPVYAVGAATAEAARAAGFTAVTAGRGDVVQVLRRAATDGVASLLHLTGVDRTGFDPESIRIEVRAVYSAEPVDPPPSLADGLARGAVALLHSARAARRFRELGGTGHRIAAISAAVLAAAGDGWAATAVAERPTDDALLAAAAPLCH